jgi:hypothetical protein
MIGRALVLAAAGLALAVPAAGAAPPSKAVATVSNAHYRAVVRAAKTSGGAAPTAAASLVVYSRSHGSWRRTRTQSLPGTYFWKTLTAPHAVCRLHLASAKLSVSLLVTPSLGCAPVKTVRLR